MNYYNEFDHNAAEWLRQLIEDGLIPKGEVDERSIADVGANELLGYTQCHFFAGIGGWPLALQLAGWPEDKPVWTGSCPCQAFSTAGKQKGFADERDLWPVFRNLIAECRPDFVIGEQVENAIKHGWLDRVYSDLEAEKYTCGSVVLGAHSVGAPHRRYRLYWGAVRLAENTDGRRCGGRSDGDQAGSGWEVQTPGLGDGGGVADDNREQCDGGRHTGENRRGEFADGSIQGLPPWSSSRFVYCRDNKVRRVPAESLLLGVADGVFEGVDGIRVAGISETGGFPLTTQKDGRAMLLKGYGNAICVQTAAEFVKAFIAEME